MSDRAASAVCLLSEDWFAYGCSLQGESHRRTDTPCQDFCGAKTVYRNGKAYLIAAVADGVGSCQLSHLGARAAVRKVIRSCAHGLAAAETVSDQAMEQLLREGFRAAQELVEDMAERLQQLTYSFFSTLTACIYDGSTLHIGHIGDDGVVVLAAGDDTPRLVTRRHKGEEANSVCPLQHGEGLWQFFTVDGPVDGFLLATDGVLDSFVKSQRYENIVYTPFAANFLFQPIADRQELEELLTGAAEFLDGSAFREQVSDDITLLAVGSRRALTQRPAPAFDPQAWDAKIAAVDARAREQLYRKPVEKPAAKPTEKQEKRCTGPAGSNFACTLCPRRSPLLRKALRRVSEARAGLFGKGGFYIIQKKRGK